MTQTVENEAHWRQRIKDWLACVEGLVKQAEEWSAAEGWEVDQQTKPLHDKLIGDYEAPSLLIRLPGGEILLNPIGLHVGGGGGRVDMEAMPTLARVKLIGGPDWRIITDSNVPIREPWRAETFVQLVHDLLA